MLSAATGATDPSCHSAISSGRTPASTSVSSRPSRGLSAASMLRSVAVLPDRATPQITAREPSPSGVSHSIAASVGSAEPNARRTLGYAAGRSSYGARCATVSADAPLIVSTRTSDG